MVRLFLYGIAAALIFNKIYFPAIDPITGTLAAFGTYAVGFVARPLGGIVFGHFGDRVGRKSMLMISLMLMGVPTVLIGLTPSYESIGYWGAVALVFCRFLQGLAVGGEWGGAVLMAVEHAPEGKKGLFGSLPQVGVAPGLILSSLAMGAVSRLPEADMLSWGWRLPFLASVFLLLVGWYIRAKVGESPEFQAALAQPKPEAPPLRVLRDHKAPVLAALVACISEKTWFYTIATFSLTYAVGTLGLPRETILNGVIWGAAAALVTIPLFGWLGDRCSKQAIFIAGALGISLFSAGFFALLDERRRTTPTSPCWWPSAWSMPPCTRRSPACSPACSRPRCATPASRWPCRSAAPLAAALRRWSPPVGAGRRLAPADRVLSGGAGRGGGGVRADDAAISPAAGAGRRAVRVGQGGQARRAAGQPLNAGLKAGLEARP